MRKIDFTVARGCLFDARLRTAVAEEQEYLWTVAIVENRFLFYFDEAESVGVASSKKNIALLKEKKDRRYESCQVWSSGRSARRPVRGCG